MDEEFKLSEMGNVTSAHTDLHNSLGPVWKLESNAFRIFQNVTRISVWILRKEKRRGMLSFSGLLFLLDEGNHIVYFTYKLVSLGLVFGQTRILFHKFCLLIFILEGDGPLSEFSFKWERQPCMGDGGERKGPPSLLFIDTC